jgi:transposase
MQIIILLRLWFAIRSFILSTALPVSTRKTAIATRSDKTGKISIIALPAKCPELNPVENIWQFMRDNWLSNRVFTSHENIVELCCEAWNKLIDQPWRIMTIGHRKWASGL